MKRTLGDVICQNTDTIQALPLNVFRLDNNLVPCDDPARSQLDFEAIAKAIIGKSDNDTTNANDKNDNYSSDTSSETIDRYSQKPLNSEEVHTEPSYGITKEFIASTNEIYENGYDLFGLFGFYHEMGPNGFNSESIWIDVNPL